MELKRIANSILVLLSFAVKYSDSASSHPLFLLVIYDGFRWDYLDVVKSHYGNVTPNFDRLIASGVKAHHAIPAFPTETMPTHMTLLTGLYPESHGIVSNDFYDPDLSEWYFMNRSDQADSRYFDVGSEPIWVTNQKTSNDRYTGATLFPDTYAAVKGVNVSYIIKSALFNRSITYEDRVNAMITWFTQSHNPINLGLFYYGEPDYAGHDFGPESTELLDAIVSLDNLTGYLLDQLAVHGLYERMNMIFTGDHGMTYLSKYRSVNVDDYVERGDYSASSISVMPKPGLELKVYNNLKKLEADHPQFRFIWKNDSSEDVRDLHYSDNRRVASILVIPDLGWTVVHGDTMLIAGTHGYRPTYSDMWPYFIASGPAFRETLQTGPVYHIDVYTLMCHVLGIPPAPNNGSLDRMMRILKPKARVCYSTFIMYAFLAIICVGVAGFIACMAFINYRIFRAKKYQLEPVTADTLL